MNYIQSIRKAHRELWESRREDEREKQKSQSVRREDAQNADGVVEGIRELFGDVLDC